MPTLEVSHRPERQRYELFVDGEHAGHITYVTIEDVLVLDHTKVLPAYEGQGLASTLAKTVLDDLRDAKTDFKVECPYLKRWISQHPDYADVEVIDLPDSAEGTG